ncbi:MAG: hypothetical protein M0P13_08580 [Fibrobacteraceae bacterium]|nr:hypothetical protein [Fibrobacteraceae bacterium]
MVLTERIEKLIKELSKGLVERESILRLGFLAVIAEQPTYIYGRAGSGKRAIIDRLTKAFKDLNISYFGKRSFNLPAQETPADIAFFTTFDSNYPPMINAVQAMMNENLSRVLILSGRTRPDIALSESGLYDSIHIILSLPASISPNALEELLSNRGDLYQITVPPDLPVTKEEWRSWSKEIDDVKISEDSFIILKSIAAECEKEGVYISAKRWRGLSKIARAEAFFSGRKETNITDFLFFNNDLWGKKASNEAIRSGFDKGMQNYFTKYAANPDEFKLAAANLIEEAERIKNATGDVYRTTKINEEDYIRYTITVAGELITLYVPASKIGSKEDFAPLNELKHTENRVRCNFMGGNVCKVSIDIQTKHTGMRASTNTFSGTTASRTFEEFAKLPAEVLKSNDPETIMRNKVKLESIKARILETVEQSAQSLKNLKALYNEQSRYQSDPFIDMVPYKNFMDSIAKRFKELGEIGKDLQKADSFLKENA